METLVGFGVDINAVNQHARSALMLAVQVKAVQLLLSLNADTTTLAKLHLKWQKQETYAELESDVVFV